MKLLQAINRFVTTSTSIESDVDCSVKYCFENNRAFVLKFSKECNTRQCVLLTLDKCELSTHTT